jgi:hypothetical protein
MRVVKKNEIAIRVDVNLRIQNYISQALGRFAITPSFVLVEPQAGIEPATAADSVNQLVVSGRQRLATSNF